MNRRSLSIRRVGALAGLCALTLFSHQRAQAQTEAWPDTVVRVEELRALKPFLLRVPRVPVKGEVAGPAVVKAHIDETGHVARVALLDTSGNPSVDEAAMRSVRDMRFQPYTVGGQPTPATLVLPVHVPKQYGRSD